MIFFLNNMYEIINEPRNNIYSKLVDFLIKNCNAFILVKKDQLKFNENCEKIINSLKPYLINEYKSDEWPGTKLLGNYANIYNFECNLNTSEILKNACVGLYSWLSPNFPEDICFYVSNDPFLVTISHEKTGLLNNIENKIVLFKNELPEIRLECFD